MTDEHELAVALVHLENSAKSEYHHDRLYGTGDKERCYKLVEAAYRAEHPADEGFEITEEWLRGVGFTESPNPRYMAIKGKDHALCCRKSGELTSVMNHGEVFDKTSKEMIVVELGSRRQLRSLCSALGITLKEEPADGR